MYHFNNELPKNHPLHEISEHTRWLVRRLDAINADILKHQAQTKFALAKYKVGDMVQLRTKQGVKPFFVKEVEFYPLNPSGLGYTLVTPNIDGSMPKKGKVQRYFLDQNKLTSLIGA